MGNTAPVWIGELQMFSVYYLILFDNMTHQKHMSTHKDLKKGKRAGLLSLQGFFHVILNQQRIWD